MIRQPLPPVARRAAWLGALALLLTAMFSQGVHHADEHFQILEFAGWKLGITPESDLPWEFSERMRPALQPAMVVAVHHVLSVLGEPDPFAVSMLLRLFTAVLTFIAALMLLRGWLLSEPRAADVGWLRFYLFLAFFLWFAVYCGVRFSSEGFSAALFAMGFAGIVFPRDPSTRWPLLLCGTLLGLSIVARLQMVLMAAGLLAWCFLIERMPWKRIMILLAGCISASSVGVLIDRWFYGEWVLTAGNYIDLNLLQGRASEFGTQPWWYYLTVLFERLVPPFSLLFLLPPLVFFALHPRHALTWTVMPFLVAHMLLPHKEYRFLFPLLPLLPLLVVGGLVAIDERGWLNGVGSRVSRIFRAAFVAVHVPLLLVVMFKPAQDDAGLYRELYHLTGPGDVLLHANDDPYRQVTPIWYTRPSGIRVEPIQDFAEWPSEGRVFFVAREKAPMLPPGTEATLLYSSLPEWLLRLNAGGWADRTAVWRIWQLDRE